MGSNLRVILRRWYVLAAGFAVTVGLAALALFAVSPTYTSEASVVLLPPPSTVDGKPTNPYLAMGGLESVADVLTTAMSDAKTADDLGETIVINKYSVERDKESAGPLLMISVEGESKDEVLAAQTFLLDRLPVTLEALQTKIGVPTTARIGATTITVDTDPTRSRRDQVRALLMAVGGGLSATFLAAAAVDSILTSRQQRRRRIASGGAAASALPTEPADPFPAFPGDLPVAPAGGVAPSWPEPGPAPFPPAPFPPAPVGSVPDAPAPASASASASAGAIPADSWPSADRFPAQPDLARAGAPKPFQAGTFRPMSRPAGTPAAPGDDPYANGG